MQIGFFIWGDSIDISNLIKENEDKLSATDLTIAKEILDNGIDYSLSINELAKKCYTSRTSVLRFSKKLGFSGYSELKFFVNDNNNELGSGESLDENLANILKKLYLCDKILIYGNGGYENIIKQTIKILLEEVGILSEVYSGGEETLAFTDKMLEDSGVFIVDFSDDSLAKQLMLQIANIDCLKINVGLPQTKAYKADYSIYYRDTKSEINFLSLYIKHLEDFFKKYQEAVKNDFNWISYRKLWKTK